MSPSLIQYLMNYSILSCTSITSHSKSEKSASHYQPFIYLIVQFNFTCIALSECVTLLEAILQTRLQCYVQFLCLQSYRFYSFPKSLGSAFYPNPQSEFVSNICNKVRFFCYSLHFIRDPKLYSFVRVCISSQDPQTSKMCFF